jgi:hypothetical protein
MVGLTLEQLPDPGELVVRETELAVDRLFRDRAQEVIVAAPSDEARSTPRGRIAGVTTLPW